MDKTVLFKVLFFIPFFANAQDLLSVEEAVKITLKNNFEIRLAANELEADKAAVSIGNAGFLPTVGATANSDNSIQNSSQTRADGNEIEQDDARNNSLNYGVVMDWTIFGGFRMFARYDQLKALQELGEAELEMTILERVSDVLITYYDLVQQQQQLAALDSTLAISEQRLELANNRFTIGKASKLEVLNARVDLNTDKTTILGQKENLATTKILLNQLMGREIDINFVVEEEIPLEDDIVLPELINVAMEKNPELQAQIINRSIAQLQLKQVKAARLPSVVASTGYQFNDSESSLGFNTSSTSQGWNYGLSARMNIFDGFTQNQDVKIAKIQVENSEIGIEQQEQILLANLGTAYQNYLANLALVELEKNNEVIAKENLEITMEKFKIGTIPTIEFRTAQLNYINAIVRFSNAKFQAKLSEISLKEFAGILL